MYSPNAAAGLHSQEEKNIQVLDFRSEQTQPMLTPENHNDPLNIERMSPKNILEVMCKDLSRPIYRWRPSEEFLVKQKSKKEKNQYCRDDPEVVGRIRISFRVTSPSRRMVLNDVGRFRKVYMDMEWVIFLY